MVSTQDPYQQFSSLILTLAHTHGMTILVLIIYRYALSLPLSWSTGRDELMSASLAQTECSIRRLQVRNPYIPAPPEKTKFSCVAGYEASDISSACSCLIPSPSPQVTVEQTTTEIDLATDFVSYLNPLLPSSDSSGHTDAILV